MGQSFKYALIAAGNLTVAARVIAGNCSDMEGSCEEIKDVALENLKLHTVSIIAGFGSKGDKMRLIEPTMEYVNEIQAFRQEFLAEGGSMDGCGSLRRFDNIQDWIDQVELLKKAETTPPNLVPITQYIYVRKSNRKIVGVIQIRHYFNEYLEKYAGHIGYSICPSERRKGYATKMLASVLPECSTLGIDRVLVCCLQDNEGSRRTIINNGGVYESTVYLPERDVYLERYWIDLLN